jgi:hypothetical protein
MKRRSIIIVAAVLVVCLCLLFYHLYGGSTTPLGQQPLVRLNSANLPALKEAFNGSANSVRVLVLLSPT